MIGAEQHKYIFVSAAVIFAINEVHKTELEYEEITLG